MSRILNRQRQLAEAGRLRLGTTVPTGNGKTRPTRSETWILSSHSEDVVRAAAKLWGGTPEQWQPMGSGAVQWRVITEASGINAILPPGDPLTQAYEQWSKGGAQRRCDGGTEQFSGNPCLCLAEFGIDWYEQPKGQVCDTKTRLKVLLEDMPGLGSYRVETGSYYAADEIAGMVDFIRSAVGDQALVPIRLRIESRTRVAGGQTKQFIVPVVELRGVTTGQVLSGGSNLMQISAGAGSPALQQIEAGPSRDWLAEAAMKASFPDDTTDDLRALWREAKAAGAGPVVLDGIAALATEAAAKALGNPDAADDPDDNAEPQDLDEAWARCVMAAGDLGWDLDALTDDYAGRHNGELPEGASWTELVDYLAVLRALNGSKVHA